MRAFCPIKFEQDPLGDRIYAKVKMTWGHRIRNSYPDWWGWASEVKFMASKSVARPVIMYIIDGDKI